MGGQKYGFYTGELQIPPYLTRQEIMEDCEAGEIPHVFRKNGKGFHIVHRDQVEPYLRKKEIPDFLIEQKLKELKILSQAQQSEIVQRVIAGKLSQMQQLSLLENMASA